MTVEWSKEGVGVAYRRSVHAWVALVDGIGEQWSAATPCTDWDVRQLVNHVVGEDRWTEPLLAGLTIADVGETLDGDLLGDDPSTAARRAAEEAITAADHRLPRGGTVQLSYGEEDLEEYLWQLTADHLIHGWDLAAATGQKRSIDAALVDAVGSWFAERESLYRSVGAIAPRPDGAVGDSPDVNLLVAFGRDPAWTADPP